MDREARTRIRRPAAQGGLRDHELARLVQTLPRDDPRREAACEQLVSRYQALVRSCAQRYRDSPEPLDELMQVGYVGLLKAINNFDTEVGESLPAYAQPCVSGEIKRYFRDKRWQLRVRRSDQELLLKARAVRADLVQELGRTPGDAEVARLLEVTVEELEAADAAASAFAPASLDAELGGAEGLTL
ncbi:MAG TPA: sigma-70 family RNA polymerase sigma factor, partial [Streptosporangiaceae bacterium]